MAEGVTLAYYLKTIGFDVTDDCLIIHGDLPYLNEDEPREEKEFCNDGDTKIRVYVGTKLVDEGLDHVFLDKSQILIAYDDDGSPKRNYPSMLVVDRDEPRDEPSFENLESEEIHAQP